MLCAISVILSVGSWISCWIFVHKQTTSSVMQQKDTKSKLLKIRQKSHQHQSLQPFVVSVFPIFQDDSGRLQPDRQAISMGPGHVMLLGAENQLVMWCVCVFFWRFCEGDVLFGINKFIICCLYGIYNNKIYIYIFISCYVKDTSGNSSATIFFSCPLLYPTFFVDLHPCF